MSVYRYPGWVVLAGTLIGILATACAVLLDRWAARHWADPIEDADDTPLEGDDQESLAEYLNRDEGWTPDEQTLALARKAVEPVSVDPAYRTMAEAALVEGETAEVAAWWWVNDRTLHVITCPQVARAQQLAKESPERSKLAPVPSYDEALVRAWVERQVLHPCGTCNPLSQPERSVRS